MKFIKYVFTLAILIMFSSCENDNNIPLNESSEAGDTNPFLQNFGSAIQARFLGTVVNEENNPIAGVTINIGSQFAVTDANGAFSIPQATVYQKFANIKATKSGFIDGSRSIVPSTGVNQVKIMLLSLDSVATITAGQAFTLGLTDGTEVELPESFINQFGGPYQGNIDVIIKHLSVDDANMKYQMPGTLLAENAEGALRVLETVGMIAVELRGEAGEELNIAPGQTAKIKIPVGSSVTNPPVTIPLWSFDEDNGYWKEEGFGELDGDKFVAEVSHFSFWNWDFQYPAVNVCITLEDANGNVLPNTELDIYSSALNATGTYGLTNANGEECGLVPQDEEITLIVPNYGCQGVNFTTTIGPFAADENITITVSNSTALTTNFSATFNNCSGEPITDGYLNLFYNNINHFIPVTNGIISQVITYCSSDTAFTAQVFDFTNNQSSNIISGNFSSPNTDLGTEMSCVELIDTDSDGITDILEDLNENGNLEDDDTDQDGTPNYQDVDDDGDGINTIDEDANNDGNPMNDDTDLDQTPDYLDDIDNNSNMFDAEIYEIGCVMGSYTYDFSLYYESGDFPNFNYTYYETLQDAQVEVNALSMPYTSTLSGVPQTYYVRVESGFTGQNTIGVITALGYPDSDGDGLLDCEETSGIDYPETTCNPNGNITNPNLADSDGDGLTDCEEVSGVDDASTLCVPEGITDPNLLDTDGDGNNDC